MKNSSYYLRGPLLRKKQMACFAGLLAAASLGYSQEAEEEDIFELSPFTVDASSDVGYAATETLGGTRLRTEVRDVGSSITSLTAEFLDDLGATTFEEAFQFTPSAGENEGDITQSNSSMNVGIWGAERGLRIRGFGFNNGSNRDFFETFTDGDRYNVERFTVSRGPNSMLFGVGGPGGVTIAASKRAQLHRNKTSVEFAGDSNGSLRTSLDHNQMIVEDKLAFRFNGLLNRKDTYRDYEGTRSERFSAAIEWKPLEGTKIDAIYETGDREINSFGKVPPIYKSFARWDADGRPTVDFVSGGWWSNQPEELAEGVESRYLDNEGNRVPVREGVVDADGFINEQSDFYSDNSLFAGYRQSYIYNGGDESVDGALRSIRWQGTPRNNAFQAGEYRANLPAGEGNPFGLSDYVTVHPASWDYPMQKVDYEWKQIFVEQKITDKFYIEYAFNHATREREYTPEWASSMLNIDVNRYLSDGTDNPYFMLPYNEYGLQMNEEFLENTAHRVTASYELDFTVNDGWSKWLGKHNLAALGSMETRENSSNTLRMINTDESRYQKGNVLNGQNQLRTRNYFYEGAPRPKGAYEIFENLDEINQQENIIHGVASEQAGINFQLLPSQVTTPSEQDLEAMSFAWQARFFNNRLVTTVGYRSDHVKTYTAPNLRSRVIPGVVLPDNQLDENGDPIEGIVSNLRSYHYADELVMNEEPNVDIKGINRTYSAVYHATQWMSLTYSQSTNFEVPGSIFDDIGGGITEPNQGDGEDFGVRFYLWDSKMVFSLNYFENESDSVAGNTWNVLNDTNENLGRLRARYRDGDNIMADEETEVVPFAAFADMADEYRSEIRTLRDRSITTTEGYEATVTFNPNKHWRIYLSGSVNENKLNDQLPGATIFQNTYADYTGFQRQREIAAELQLVADGLPSVMFAEFDHTNVEHQDYAREDAEYIIDNVNADESTLNGELDLIGVQQNRNGKYNANGVVTYKFTEGALKGLDIGGNFRFRSAPIVGYYRLPDEEGRPTRHWDVTRPIEGDGSFTMGAMMSYRFKHEIFGKKTNARLQLNVYNLLDDTDLRLVRVEHDSSGYYGEVDAIVPLQYQTVDPRYYRLSLNLDF